jgi:hypothetical protein
VAQSAAQDTRGQGLHTRRAAVQIYHGLDERTWGVFLDTHSITRGVNFQDNPWDQMANADLLLLLDSPGVVSSYYVQQELARAHDLGMGVLQLIWPTQTRTPGTEFCEPRRTYSRFSSDVAEALLRYILRPPVAQERRAS